MKQHKTVQHSFPVLLLPSCVSELLLPDQMEITLPGPTEVTLPGPTEVTLPGPTEVTLPGPTEITLPGPTEITLTNPMDVTLQGPALPTPRTVNISPQPVVLLGMVDARPSPKIDLPGASPESSQLVDASVPAQLGALFIPVLPGDSPQFSGVLQSAPSVSESDLASHETVLPVPKLASFETTYLVPEMANSEPIYPVQSELADVVNPVPESAECPGLFEPNRIVLSDTDAPEAEHLLLLPDPEPESAELSELAILGRMYPEPKLTVPELILPVPAKPMTVLRTWPQDGVRLHCWTFPTLLEGLHVCCQLPARLPARPPEELRVCSRLPASERLRLHCWSSTLLRCRPGPAMVPNASYVLGFLLLNFFGLCNPGLLNAPH
ncbi:uncharacterized protein LOC109202858 isoform X1 [Oreochromis niloticus]|uniref:uncharacterized protein LOC109202858 isoform X1 n=2 Tax=Oreochromis niloticus TaxID=8128 RepID=UPI000DF44D3A|nr:uncharacterized protein LOC109202858 isoform X1 [Oreochromis niloticus]XP_025764319.1 uncharacterized protein LOC109202858 isoform X1 [Oreochromis niloticus]XP_025764320.1 uncharacterized protein LOC109202858 isoform X1 [Oreochromis niloticus]